MHFLKPVLTLLAIKAVAATSLYDSDFGLEARDVNDIYARGYEDGMEASFLFPRAPFHEVFS